MSPCTVPLFLTPLTHTTLWDDMCKYKVERGRESPPLHLLRGAGKGVRIDINTGSFLTVQGALLKKLLSFEWAFCWSWVWEEHRVPSGLALPTAEISNTANPRLPLRIAPMTETSMIAMEKAHDKRKRVESPQEDNAAEHCLLSNGQDIYLCT